MKQATPSRCLTRPPEVIKLNHHHQRNLNLNSHSTALNDSHDNNEEVVMNATPASDDTATTILMSSVTDDLCCDCDDFDCEEHHNDEDEDEDEHHNDEMENSGIILPNLEHPVESSLPSSSSTSSAFCVYQDPIHASSLESSSTCLMNHGRRVAFCSVEFREYSMTLGDHPDCTNGPPLTLDWSYTQKAPLSVDEVEAKRGGRRRRLQALIIPYFQRKCILRKFGVTDIDMYNAIEEVNKVKKLRQKSVTSKTFVEVGKKWMRKIMATMKLSSSPPPPSPPCSPRDSLSRKGPNCSN